MVRQSVAFAKRKASLLHVGDSRYERALGTTIMQEVFNRFEEIVC